MVMHHLFMMLNLTIIQGYNMDLNHENNNCSMILETVQAMQTKFAQCEDSPTKGLLFYIIFSQTYDLDLHSRSQLRLKLDKIMLNLYNSHISDSTYLTYGIQTWHDGKHMQGIYK